MIHSLRYDLKTFTEVIITTTINNILFNIQQCIVHYCTHSYNTSNRRRLRYERVYTQDTLFNYLNRTEKQQTQFKQQQHEAASASASAAAAAVVATGTNGKTTISLHTLLSNEKNCFLEEMWRGFEGKYNKII